MHDTIDIMNGAIEIKAGVSNRELHQVGRFRYDVTVREMGLSMAYANHDKQTVIEPLDKTGLIFAAWQNGNIVGTLRLNLLRDGDVGHYFNLYALGLYAPEIRDRLSIGTRLAIAPQHRGGRLFLRLSCAAYRYMYEQNVEYNILDCRKRLFRNFERLGYFSHCGDIQHPEFGDVTVLQLAIRDVDRLKESRSPLLAVYNSLQTPESDASNEHFELR